MPIVNKTWQKMATSATMEALARAGPTLARLPPVRRAAVNAAENFIMKRLRHVRANGGLSAISADCLRNLMIYPLISLAFL